MEALPDESDLAIRVMATPAAESNRIMWMKNTIPGAASTGWP